MKRTVERSGRAQRPAPTTTAAATAGLDAEASRFGLLVWGPPV